MHANHLRRRCFLKNKHTSQFDRAQADIPACSREKQSFKYLCQGVHFLLSKSKDVDSGSHPSPSYATQ